MPGLLDDMEDPRTAGLLSLGLRMMQAPGNFGQALGSSGMGAMQDMQQARQQAMQSQAIQMQMHQQQLMQAQKQA